jgi:DNA recombination protein RmuC
MDINLIFGTAIAAIFILVIFLIIRKPRNSSDFSSTLQNLALTTQQMQVELGKLSERVSAIQNDQNSVGLGVQSLQISLSEGNAIAKNQMHNAQQVADSVRRLEMVIAGTNTKGSAGENILETIFAKLPAEWLEPNFRVNNKPVEFALRLPNDLILPIDSKWPATGLLEKFIAATEITEQLKLKNQIHTAVLDKAREVKKYIDPDRTIGFGIAVVPDAIYDLCFGVQAEAFQDRVVVMSYSMLFPYLLLIIQTTFKTSKNIDLEKLGIYLQTAQESVKTLQKEIDGRFADALKRLQNGREEMKTELSKISSSLNNLQSSADNIKAEKVENKGFSILEILDNPSV